MKWKWDTATIARQWAGVRTRLSGLSLHKLRKPELRQFKLRKPLAQGKGMTLTLKRKLIGSLSIILVMFLLVALYNLSQVQAIKGQLQQQNEKVELKLMALELKEMTQELNIITSGLEISKKTEYIPRYNEKRKVYDQMLKRIGATADTDEKIVWRSKLLLLTNEYTSTFDTAARLVQDTSMASKDLDSNMEYLYNESQRLMGEIFGYVDQFYVSYAKDAEAAIAVTQNKLNTTVTIMIAAFLVVVAIGVVIAVLLTRSFTKPIQQLQLAFKQMAGGDLRSTIDSYARDELGELSRSFDQMVVAVSSMVYHTQTIASSLSEHSRSFQSFSGSTAAANKEIIKAIQEISIGAEQQAQHAEQSAVFIGDLESEIATIASFADGIRRRSREAAFNTHTGSTSMEALREAAQRSENVLHKVYDAMEELAQNSAQIGKIVASITDISAQTNVLALNAAIEAARAGAHGKGFSVIAEEVRRLSSQTNDSSKLIARIVGTLQGQMKELDTALAEAKASFEVQNGKTAESLDSFKQIRASMDELSENIDQIHLRIEGAKEKNGHLVESVQHVAAIAQQTAAGVQEVNSSSMKQDGAIHHIAHEAEDILGLAQRLFHEIGQFRIAENAAAAAPPQTSTQLRQPEQPRDDAAARKEEAWMRLLAEPAARTASVRAAAGPSDVATTSQRSAAQPEAGADRSSGTAAGSSLPRPAAASAAGKEQTAKEADEKKKDLLPV